MSEASKITVLNNNAPSPTPNKKPYLMIGGGIVASLLVAGCVYKLSASLKGRVSIPSEPAKLPQSMMPVSKNVVPVEFEFSFAPSLTEGVSPSPEQVLKEIHERIQQGTDVNTTYLLRKGEEELKLSFCIKQGRVYCSAPTGYQLDGDIVPHTASVQKLQEEMMAATFDMQMWYGYIPTSDFKGAQELRANLVAKMTKIQDVSTAKVTIPDDVAAHFSSNVQAMLDEIEETINSGKPGQYHRYEFGPGDYRYEFNSVTGEQIIFDLNLNNEPPSYVHFILLNPQHPIANDKVRQFSQLIDKRFAPRFNQMKLDWLSKEIQMIEEFSTQPFSSILLRVFNESTLPEDFRQEVLPLFQKAFEEIEAHVQSGQPWNKLYKWTTSQGEICLRFMIKPDGHLCFAIHRNPLEKGAELVRACDKELMKAFKFVEELYYAKKL